MQTFLPYDSFVDSARCLDYRRLGKQRVEAMQLLNIIKSEKTKGGWVNHPATKMWRNYPEALGLYMNVCIEEWINRGYKNTMSFYPVGEHILYPHWFGDKVFHDSHKSNLLRKDPIYYNQFNWKVPNNRPYVWPV